MGKRKTTTTTNKAAPVALVPPAAVPELPREPLPDPKMETLRQLNAYLAKETLDKRARASQLESEKEELLEMAELERSVSSLVFSSALSSAAAHLAAEKAAAERLMAERDAALLALDGKEEVARALHLKVRDLEFNLLRIQSALEIVEKDRNDLLIREKEKVEVLRSMLQENESLELSLSNSEKLLEDFDRQMEKMNSLHQEEVELLKADRASILERERESLADAKHLFDEQAADWRSKNDLLKSELMVVEMKEAETRKELKRVQEETMVMVREKLEGEKRFELENGELVAKLENAERKVREVSVDRQKIEAERNSQIIIVDRLEKERTQLQSIVSKLQWNIESLKSDLDSEKVVENQLRLYLEEAKNSKSHLEDELRQVTLENEEIKINLEVLMNEKASIEERMKAAELNSGQLSLLLKRASAALHSLEEEFKENVVFGSEEEMAEEMQFFAAEIAKIKMAFMSKVGEVNKMRIEIEMLECRLAEEHKKRGLWTWLLPATTTAVAAATLSLAYAARG